MSKRPGHRYQHVPERYYPGARLTTPEQFIAGPYVQKDDGKQEEHPGKERHRGVTATEALEALRKTKGRAVIGVFGLAEEYPEPGLNWKNGVLGADQRAQFEKRLEQIEQDVAQYSADRRAFYTGRLPKKAGGKLNSSEVQLLARDIRAFEQGRMVELIYDQVQHGHTRVSALAFSNAPLNAKGKRK